MDPIVTAPLNRRVFDILPSRTVGEIQDYLRSFPNRDEVKYVVMDINRVVRDVAKAFLPNAKIIIDRFRVIRCCTKTIENVRKSFQKTLPKAQRKYFKHSRRLLLAHHDWLTEEVYAAVDAMFHFSDRLLQAYTLRKAFYDFMSAPNRNEAERQMDFWLENCGRLNLPEFKP